MNQERQAVPWSIGDALVIFIMAWIGLPLIVLFGLHQQAGIYPWAADLLKKFSSGDIAANFYLITFDATAALGLVWLYLKKYNATWRDVGLRRFNIWRALGFLLVSLIALSILVALAYAAIKLLLPSFNANQPQSNDFTKSTSPSTLPFSFLALVILPPIIEEIVFRGFMFPAFAKRWGLVGGAVGSSVLFGIAHLQGNVTVYTIVLGLLLCLMYRKLGSILPGMALHMLNNYLAFMAIIHK